MRSGWTFEDPRGLMCTAAREDKIIGVWDIWGPPEELVKAEFLRSLAHSSYLSASRVYCADGRATVASESLGFGTPSTGNRFAV